MFLLTRLPLRMTGDFTSTYTLLSSGSGIFRKKRYLSYLRNGEKYQIVNISISNTYQKIEMSTSFPIL